MATETVTKPVRPIPEGYQAVIPYLAVKDAPKLIAFLKEAFGAKQISLLKKPDGTVANAELKVYDSVVMVAEARSADATSTASLYVYVTNADKVYAAALKAGASSLMKPDNMFYGDRNAGVLDACGNKWWIATHVEDVSEAELTERMAKKVASTQN